MLGGRHAVVLAGLDAPLCGICGEPWVGRKPCHIAWKYIIQEAGRHCQYRGVHRLPTADHGVSTQGGGYLSCVQRTVLPPPLPPEAAPAAAGALPPTDQPSSAQRKAGSPGPASTSSGDVGFAIQEEEEDPASVAGSPAGSSSPPQLLTLTCHVAYHPSYRVPVLYFEVGDSSQPASSGREHSRSGGREATQVPQRACTMACLHHGLPRLAHRLGRTALVCCRLWARMACLWAWGLCSRPCLNCGKRRPAASHTPL